VASAMRPARHFTYEPCYIPESRTSLLGNTHMQSRMADLPGSCYSCIVLRCGQTSQN